MRRPQLPALAAITALIAILGLAACEPASANTESTRTTAGSGAPSATPALDSPADSARKALLARADLGRIKGDSTAPVWLVVVSDFQCPYCKVWHDETAPRIEREYVRTGKVRVAYLNFPINSHRNAWPAHEAAMCAAEQDRFWPVADALFETQAAWKGRGDAPAYFDSLTSTLSLDHARLRTCIADGALRPLIQADFDRSQRIGVGSTPSFFIGDRLLIGAQPFEAFKSALDAALDAVPPLAR
jgi:protein-disulfide isomerase